MRVLSPGIEFDLEPLRVCASGVGGSNAQNVSKIETLSRL